jgi:hypothetical protein
VVWQWNITFPKRIRIIFLSSFVTGQAVEVGSGPISVNTSQAKDGIAMPSTTGVTI